MRIIFGTIVTSILCIGALKKQSLSPSGALGAAFVGLSTATNDNLVFVSVLLAFFISSSFWTKYNARLKSQLESGYKKSSQRNWKQVMCNGLIGSVISLIYQWNFDGREIESLSLDERKYLVLLIWGYVGFYACCSGDTWASELGTLSSEWPVLVTSWKRVPPGTNGGISKLGILSSFAGGACVGLVADVVLWIQYFGGYRSGALPKIPYNILGSLFGLLGSLIDSLLGATVQATFYDQDSKKIVSEDQYNDKTKNSSVKHVAGLNLLNNNQVNVFSSVAITAIAIFVQVTVFSTPIPYFS